MVDDLKTYLSDSRELTTSAILVFPLFVLYQIGLLATGGVRNGVDFMTDVLMMAAGGNFWTYFLINLGILLAFGGFVLYLKKTGEFHPKIWPWVIAESTLYAMVFGSTIVLMMQGMGLDVLLASGAGGDYGIIDSFVLSLGAGLYEELVFRLILMGGLFYVGKEHLDWPTWVSALTALIVSSLLFSGVHYIGSLADPFELGSFTYRFIAGILLAAIYYFRGFAVAVYTHAIYDIIVMVFN